MTVAERIEALRAEERTAKGDQLRRIRRQIAMLTEDVRPRQPTPELSARAYR